MEDRTLNNIIPLTMPTAEAPLPFWQTRPCPPWCDTTHREQDFHDDRNHFATPVDTIDLSLYVEDGHGGGSQPGTLDLAICQHYRHAEPEIDLTLPVCEGSSAKVTGETELTLTVAEARALRDGLSALLDALGTAGNAEVAA